MTEHPASGSDHSERIEMDCHGTTHVGKRRETNEDQFLIAELNKSMKVIQTSLGLNHQTRLLGDSQGKLLLVADGLGGHSSGERASSLAVDGVANYILNAMDWFFRFKKNDDDDLLEHLKQAFIHSQSVLDSEALDVPQRRDMATTLTMALIIWPNLYVVHVGDTRCYVVQDNEIRQITTDHTLANLAANARSGKDGVTPRGDQRTASEIEATGPGHALWNVIGGNDISVNPEVAKIVLNSGDRVLLCSDGLSHYIQPERMHNMLTNNLTAEAMANELVEEANALGGRDNITVVVSRFDPEGTLAEITPVRDTIKSEKRPADSV